MSKSGTAITFSGYYMNQVGKMHQINKKQATHLFQAICLMSFLNYEIVKEKIKIT